jgi:predicted small secreted protein
MNVRVLLIGWLAFLVSACEVNTVSGAGPEVKGNGVARTEQRKIGDFTAIQAEGAMKLVIQARPGPTELSLTADENILPVIVTETRDGQLVLTLQARIRTTTPIVARIATPRLEKVALSGAHDAEITVSGQPGLRIESQGASSITARGNVRRFDLSIAGAGSVDAHELQAAETRVEIDGVGSAKVFAREKLSVRAGGAANVTYYGDPKQVDRDVAGVARVAPER